LAGGSLWASVPLSTTACAVLIAWRKGRCRCVFVFVNFGSLSVWACCGQALHFSNCRGIASVLLWCVFMKFGTPGAPNAHFECALQPASYVHFHPILYVHSHLILYVHLHPILYVHFHSILYVHLHPNEYVHFHPILNVHLPPILYVHFHPISCAPTPNYLHSSSGGGHAHPLIYRLMYTSINTVFCKPGRLFSSHDLKVVVMRKC
jgi:hypothetical protein